MDVKMLFMLCHTHPAEFNFNLDYAHNIKPACIILDFAEAISVMRRKP